MLCLILFHALRFSIILYTFSRANINKAKNYFSFQRVRFNIFLFDLVSRNIHNMLQKILLALGVVVTISALGMV